MDLRTLDLVNLTLLLVFAGVVGPSAFRRSEVMGERWFAASGFIRGLALALSFAPHVPNAFIALASEILLLAGYPLMYRAFAEAVGARRLLWRPILWMCAVASVLHVLRGTGLLPLRGVPISTIPICVTLIATAVMVVRHKHRVLHVSQGLAAVMLVAYAMLRGRRFVMGQIGPAHLQAHVEMIWRLGSVIANTGIAFSFLMLTSCRLRLMLEKMATHDALTGTLNRHGAVRVLWPEVDASRQKSSAVSAISIDLDGMKEANNRYGHLCGDRVLIAATEAMATVLRGSTVPIRLGGDEFAVLLQNVEGADAAAVAERLRLAITTIRLVEWPDARISASFGVATLRGEGWAVDELLRLSDEALIHAKRTGKDRVATHQAGGFPILA